MAKTVHWKGPSMSALGQKQTYAVRKGMSALPPKADMCSATGDVRFVPKADIAPLTRLLRMMHSTMASRGASVARCR